MTKKDVLPVDGAVEVRMFRFRLEDELYACGDAILELINYSSLEDVWENWKNPEWATWFVARVLGKKHAHKLLARAFQTYLNKEHPGLARKCRGKTFPKMIKVLDGYQETNRDYATNRDYWILDNAQEILSGTAKSYGSADSASATMEDLIDGAGVGGWATRAEQSEKIMRVVRDLVPKQTFLRVARKMIKDLKPEEFQEP